MEPWIGKWIGQATLETSDRGSTPQELFMKYEFSKTKKGISLKVITAEDSSFGNKPANASGIIHYDSTAKVMYFNYTNESGEKIKMKGNWVDAKSLNFTYEASVSGGKNSLNYAFYLNSKDVLTTKIYIVTEGGKKQTAIDATLRKKNPAKESKEKKD
jgi:hypothetical protein